MGMFGEIAKEAFKENLLALLRSELESAIGSAEEAGLRRAIAIVEAQYTD